MMRTGLVAAAVLLATACTSLDTADDRRELADLVQQRTGAAVAEAPTDLDPAVADAVADLLLRPLTEAAAVCIALLHNQRVRALWARLGVARGDLVQAGLLRNPRFDVDVRFLETGGTSLEYGLAQPVVDLFVRPLRERLAEHEFAGARLWLADALTRFVFDVRRAWVDVQAATATAALQRQALQVAEAAHELQLALHAAGNATDRELAEVRVGETRARLDLAAAELAERQAREVLQALLGLWGTHTEWSLAGTLLDGVPSPPDGAQVEARAVAASFELQAHRAGLDALAQQAGLDSWRGWFPDLALGVSGVRQAGGRTGHGPRIAGELPLFDAGGTRRARTEAGLRAGLHDHTQLAVEVRAEARLRRDRAEALAAMAAFQRDEHLPARAAALRTALQHYNAMQIGAFEVLRERRQQLADEAERIDTERAARCAALDLAQLLAGSRPGPDRDAMTPPSASEDRP
ncbi:MAG: TolC family protein [Planctomycetes bacterium]|nr:TolC family protein [Planctomycetota bacterium]